MTILQQKHLFFSQKNNIHAQDAEYYHGPHFIFGSGSKFDLVNLSPHLMLAWIIIGRIIED
ncbi:unnamed protein product (macronuclear) [Paramecium tetraurelia]|uniref:Uncharacterized protein n=1 Tax=Paramecium tetraurelia TaxID=5888 RepID=A0CX80_PARTE|nr:uncharacterized protein GSPATT00001601001 [Paramecium tetraurelia]CAK75397.1 unnamed protein product [Paramecium tetraurelia]|eukprot:XP_001442794.1 hypothetical protein (macronuclear) [Paramecium tetraurelia strain d4-2]